MKLKHIFIALLFCLPAARSFATTFIVPDDAELIAKSDAIITGYIAGARAVERERGFVETIYEVAVDRVLKGHLRARTTIEISSPGGSIGDRWTIVHSAAHFSVGDEVLLFLTPYRGGWSPTDMTLGKFRFALTSAGHTVAIRDADDIAGWDRDGKVHKEKIRLDVEFLHYIEETVAGRMPAVKNYEIEASDVLATSAAAERIRGEARGVAAELFPAPAHTYSVSFLSAVTSCTNIVRFPGRWTTAVMNAGVLWRKNSAQNASGLGDGGVSVIQNALAAWTNDCESTVNIQYAGTTPNLKNSDDLVNVVVFNDPGADGNPSTRGDDHIAGSWTGSGVVATCFSNGNDTHSFSGTDFVSMDDSDVVFQDGYAGTQAAIEEVMTHEIGHGIGFRHSNQHYLRSCTGSGTFPNCSVSCSATPACDSNVEDCETSLAIMTASVSSTQNYTLFTWDKHAADALYPGTCITVLPPTNVVATATSTSTVNVSWTASAGALTYNVYRSTDAITYNLAGSTATTSFNDNGRSANTAYLYRVRAVNGGESADSTFDLATTVIFTDDPLVGGTTLLKSAHLTELRTAINAVRALASLGAGSYTDPTITVNATTAKTAHITDLRGAIDLARTNLSLSALSYGESITTSTAIKTSHFSELRNGVK
ncbi:MAG TPA: M57 family metalloprotease [Thermoanaerobaculia bacterium]|nr:M57 family metalloprotease [Thermoanaerobaculia bacterium]